MYRFFFKRFIDFIVSVLIFTIIFPFFLLLVLMLAVVNKGSPFFFQVRPGKNFKKFKVIKLKTMNDKRGMDGKLLPDSVRVTRIGKFIRASSLDEIPQLINVIKGDMSLIGPRPLLVQYVPLYNKRQARRQEIRPGITGWAQVNGRNAISWNDKFEYDVWYVDNYSFSLDLKIIWKTFKKVLYKEGINSSNDVTMEPFKGNI
jgi:lipopolysaccharide/colanic/teichoic acid biosynthesis glycosyltransferase